MNFIHFIVSSISSFAFHFRLARQIKTQSRFICSAMHTTGGKVLAVSDRRLSAVRDKTSQRPLVPKVVCNVSAKEDLTLKREHIPK